MFASLFVKSLYSYSQAAISAAHVHTHVPSFLICSAAIGPVLAFPFPFPFPLLCFFSSSFASTVLGYRSYQ